MIKNEVYKSVEGLAHGLVPVVRDEWIVIGTTGAVGGLIHPLAAIAGVIIGVALVAVGRRRWQGRREWLRLWWRRREKRRRYRVLDPDQRFKPYQGRKRASAVQAGRRAPVVNTAGFRGGGSNAFSRRRKSQ